jgi:hypothetical protein
MFLPLTVGIFVFATRPPKLDTSGQDPPRVRVA